MARRPCSGRTHFYHAGNEPALNADACPMAKPHPLLESGDGSPSLRPLYMLLPYLWPKGRPDLKLRVVISLACLALAIFATTVSPVLFGWITDRADLISHHSIPAVVAATTFALIAAFVLSRIFMQAFAQLRDGIFAKVQYHALREVGVSTFAHVHTLSLRFHLERKTGGLSRIIERGTKGIDTLLSFALFSIFPTFFQLLIFTAIMIWKLNGWIAAVTLAMVGAYVWFTFAITRWRVKYRREMNESDTDANTKAVDSLLNYETVKYFNNEAHETRRFDKSMEKYSRASIQAQLSLSLLNTGQAAIMAVGLGVVMALTFDGITKHQFTVG